MIKLSAYKKHFRCPDSSYEDKHSSEAFGILSVMISGSDGYCYSVVHDGGNECSWSGEASSSPY